MATSKLKFKVGDSVRIKGSPDKHEKRVGYVLRSGPGYYMVDGDERMYEAHELLEANEALVDDVLESIKPQDTDQPEAINTHTSDGGSTDYYTIPEGTRDLDDLIDHKNMSFRMANIFKACYRFGQKTGTDKRYDLNKIIFFAQRELEKLERNA